MVDVPLICCGRWESMKISSGPQRSGTEWYWIIARASRAFLMLGMELLGVWGPDSWLVYYWAIGNYSTNFLASACEPRSDVSPHIFPIIQNSESHLNFAPFPAADRDFWDVQMKLILWTWEGGGQQPYHSHPFLPPNQSPVFVHFLE